jgi:hypothetical protein
MLMQYRPSVEPENFIVTGADATWWFFSTRTVGVSYYFYHGIQIQNWSL